ncbi:MAG: DUF1016 domain-containing protein [Porphyromonas sp.]|nr:DUF1016 domain-containing protein [Porphyromonas sp.]
MIEVQHVSNEFLADLASIIDVAQKQAYQQVNKIQVYTYWLLGKRIVEEEQVGQHRASYGHRQFALMAQKLVPLYGTSYSERNLYNMRLLFMRFKEEEILNSRVQNLTWTHYRMLLRVEDYQARSWYMYEASREMWSVRTLNRNIGSQAYYRHIQVPFPEDTLKELECSHDRESLALEPSSLIKNPVIAEFLQLNSSFDYKELDLEKAILSHIKDFLLELGKGFAFVSEQKRIVTDTRDYFIDLVFYNYILKAFVLVDIKVGTLTHQDVGQMDMYVRMYDDLILTEGDNPTIGLLLCSETSEDIARYSVLRDNKRLFATKYLTYLPTEEELRREIKKQKEFYLAQHGDNKE